MLCNRQNAELDMRLQFSSTKADIEEICENVTILFFFFFFLGPHLWHMEIPRLGVESELQLLAYTTATQGLSSNCNLGGSLWQSRVLNPLSKARDRTHILTNTMLDF